MAELTPIHHIAHETQGHQEASRLQAALQVGRVAMQSFLEQINTRRAERAGSTLERMDHKDALYSDAGNKYTSGTHSKLGERTVTETTRVDEWAFPDGQFVPETATPTGTRARSLGERFSIARVEKKRQALKIERDKRKFTEKAFHIYETQDPAFYNSRLPVMRTIPSTPVNISGRKSGVLSASRQAGIKVGSFSPNSSISPEDARKKINLAKINKPPQESRLQRKHRKREEAAIRDLRLAAEQPVLSKWRDLRRRHAVNTIKASHHRTEKHEAIVRELNHTA